MRADGGPAQLWLLPAGGGEPEKVSDLPGGAGRPVWSPDGQRIAFAAAVDLSAADGEDDVARARRTQDPVVADRLDYQADGAGYLRGLRTHLHVLEVNTGECRRVTGGDWHAGEPAWSPDGSRLAFPAGIGEDIDLRLRVGAYTVAADAAGARPEPAGFETGFADAVVWNRDGSALLVAGSVDAPTAPAGLFRLPWPASRGSAAGGSTSDGSHVRRFDLRRIGRRRFGPEARPRRSTGPQCHGRRRGVPRRRSAIGRR